MTKKKQIYKCEICGNIVEVLHQGAESLVCCGQPMKLQEEKTDEEGMEKHIPIIKKTEEGILVTVSSNLHPMEESHYIEWIELIADGISLKKFLTPEDKPEVLFKTFGENLTAREHCNVHGLWKS